MSSPDANRAPWTARIAVIAVLIALAAGAGLKFGTRLARGSHDPGTEVRPSTTASATQAADAGAGALAIDDKQRAQIAVEPVLRRQFRTERFAIGQIAFNEDVTTPVFSPFTGRVTKLWVKLGDDVVAGTPLFDIDTPDVVQAQSDLINAAAAVAKSKTQIELNTRAFNRQHDLYLAKAVAQKDYEQAQSDLKQAESDLRANEGVVIAARNKLRILGKTEQDVARVETERRIDPIMTVNAPISGTITTRKVGPGQYVRVDNTDPLFSISDLSTMWLRANVAEADIPFIKAGQKVEVKVLAYPNETFSATITYIAASVDPTTHRVAVRSEIDNAGRLLKPEMFANFTIITGEGMSSPAVPSASVIREADASYVWLEKSPVEFERRVIRPGLESGGFVQVLSDLPAEAKVVTTGAVFLQNTRNKGG